MNADLLRRAVLKATTLDELVVAACATDSTPLADEDQREICGMILDKATPIIARDRERDAVDAYVAGH